MTTTISMICAFTVDMHIALSEGNKRYYETAEMLLNNELNEFWWCYRPMCRI